MNTIILTDQQLNNLKVFLARTTLNANEIPAYIDIQNTLERKTQPQEAKGAE